MTLKERQDDFVGIVKQHERLILKVCALYSNATREELCDLYQDAVCALWESYPSFRGESKVSTWIFSVTRYTMLAHYRKQRLQTTSLDQDNYEKYGSSTPDACATEELRNALDHLQPEEKDLMVMWLEGFELDEIAATTGVRYGAVATRLTRIKMKLKRMINPRGKERR